MQSFTKIARKKIQNKKQQHDILEESKEINLIEPLSHEKQKKVNKNFDQMMADKGITYKNQKQQAAKKTYLAQCKEYVSNAFNFIFPCKRRKKKQNNDPVPAQKDNRQKEQDSVYDKLKALYAPILGSKNSSFSQQELQAIFEENKRALESGLPIKQIPLLPIEKFNIIYDLFASLSNNQKLNSDEKKQNHEQNQFPEDSCRTILLNTFKELGIFEEGLCDQITVGLSTFGTIETQRLLFEPTNAMKELKKRQALIKSIIEDQTTFQDIQKQFDGLKKYENDIITLWRESSEIEKQYFNQAYYSLPVVYNARIPFKKHLNSFFPYIQKYLNASPNLMLLKMTFEQYIKPILVLMVPLFLFLFIHCMSIDQRENLIKSFGPDVKPKDIRTIINAAESSLNSLNNTRLHALCNESSIESTLLNKITSSARNVTGFFNNIDRETISSVCKVNKITGVNDFLSDNWSMQDTLETLVTLISNNKAALCVSVPIIYFFITFFLSACHNGCIIKMVALDIKQKVEKINKFLSSASKINQLFRTNLAGSNKAISKELSQCDNAILRIQKKCPLLLYKDFINCPMKEILATFTVIPELKEDLAQILHALGKMEAFMGITQFLKNQNELKKKYQGMPDWCFSKFITNDNPCLNLIGFWHPMLNPAKKQIITNDFGLGGVVIKPSKICFTGPNGGGKSTLLKAIAFCLWLSQTFGICPASTAELTPFYFINVSLDAIGEVGKESLFQASARKAKELKEALFLLEKSQKLNQFSLTIGDELYSGTDALHGEALISAFMQKIAISCPRSLLIIVTHYHEVTNLAKQFPNIIANMTLNEERKLQLGVWSKCNALQVVKEIGENAMFMKLVKKNMQKIKK